MPESLRNTPVGEILSEEVVLASPFFPVVNRLIRTPDGEIREGQFVWDKRGKEFSVAVALTPDKEFVLVREPKYGQMRSMLVVPTGGVKQGETPKDAAIREFDEETGYVAKDWVMLKQIKMVDSPDKSEGGEHNFFIGFDAHFVSFPEKRRSVELISIQDAEKLLDDRLEDIKLEVSMSYVALSSALRYLDKRSKQN